MIGLTRRSKELKDINIKKFWKDKIAIAFDVSTRSTGWAYCSLKKPEGNSLAKIKKIDYGVIQPPDKYSVTERIKYIYSRVLQLEPILFNGDDCYIFIEEGFFKHSGKTSLMLGEARGAVMCGVGTVPAIVEVPVATWKKHLGCQLGSVKGEKKGDLEKQMVHKKVCEKWDIDFPVSMLKSKATYDVTDAIGILTYALETLEFS